MSFNPKEIKEAVQDINSACRSIITLKRHGDNRPNGDGLTLEQRIQGVKEMCNNLPKEYKKLVKFDVNKL